jgi:hypothetical protein
MLPIELRSPPLNGHYSQNTRLRSARELSAAGTISRFRLEAKMQNFGTLLFMWGGLDWFMSTEGVDVYYDWFGIYLPDAIYDYSHWIAMGVGSILFTAGNQSN